MNPFDNATKNPISKDCASHISSFTNSKNLSHEQLLDVLQRSLQQYKAYSN